MTSDHYKLTREFMEKAGQAVSDGLRVPPPDERSRIIAVIHEEFNELCRAMGVQVTLTAGNDLALEHERNSFSYACTGDFDMVEAADALGDTQFTVQCGMIACGIPDLPLMEEICQNNLTRFGPGGYRRDDGKYIRSPQWNPPNIRKAIGMESGT